MYIGLNRYPSKVSIASSALVKGSHSAGYVIHDDYITFKGMSIDDQAPGRIWTAKLWVNNGSSTAVTPVMTLHLFTKIPKAQTKGSALSLNAGDSLNKLGEIVYPALASIENYISMAIAKDLDLDYQCAESDNNLYGIMVSAACNFDATTTAVYLALHHEKF